MKVYLFDDYEVEIDPRCIDIGGSWQDAPWAGTDRNGQFVATGEELLRFFYGKMKHYEAPVVLDIGSSTGSFTMLATLHPQAQVIAFEPNPPVVELLRENVRLNGLEHRVQIEPYALANFIGEATLKCPVMEGHSGMACMGTPQRFDAWAEWNGYYEVAVPVRTLDSFEIPWVDLIKSDAEGYELFIFEGGEELIRRCMPGILFECYGPNTHQAGYEPEEIINLLRSWGYRSITQRPQDAWAVP